MNDAGAVASIGTVADSYDNAMAESLIGLYKSECVKHDGPWPDTDALELGTLNWVWWYNNIRLHTAIGYITPVRYENAYYHRHNNPRHQPASGEPALH